MRLNESANELEGKKISKFVGPLLGIRHLQAFLLFLNIAILYVNRMHVSLSLVAMTNADKNRENFPVYDWNELEKSYILSSFYWGYLLMQFPGAYCSRRFGVKINLFVCALCTGVLSMLTPYAISRGGWQAFCALRALMGISQGGLYSSIMQHTANWSPPKERSIFCGVTHTGFDCGTVTAMLLSGVISTSLLGWPGTFYVYAALCFAWCIIWLILGANDANSSKLISQEERLYIENSLENGTNFGANRPPVPWLAIFTSRSFYALVVARCICTGGRVMMQTEWASYVNGVFQLKLKSSSLFSALPSVASWFSVYVFSFFSNLIINRNWLSITGTRKLMNSVGMWIPAAGLIFIGFLDKSQQALAFTTMILIMSFNASCNLGCIIGAIDLAPNHVEILSSIVNTTTNCVALLGPLFFGLVVYDEHDRSLWQIAFATIAVLFCLGDLIYLIWGTAEEQPWNAVDFLTRKNEVSLSEALTVGGRVI